MPWENDVNILMLIDWKIDNESKKKATTETKNDEMTSGK